MPIPETPYTRKEAYLNAAATGDSSGIPETPYTREEMYLDYIARNGGGGGGGSSTLSGLTDVDISNPTDGQTLVYNATAQKWENRIMGLVVRDIEADGHVTLDKTYAEIAAAAPFVCKQEDNNGTASYEWLWRIGPGSEPYAYMLDIGDTYVANSGNDYPEKLTL